MGANAILKSRMDELGLTQDELAGRMNTALAEITGRPGDVSARTVRNLLNGTSRRPIGRTCAALERVFGCPVEDLGFSAPRTMHHPQEDPVRRRTFIASATGTAAAAVPLVGQRRAVGMSDVARAAAGMNALVTATDVFTIMGSDPLPGRMRTLIGDFHRGLFALSPSTSYARDWADRMRTGWSRA
ncbi:helix-turn-helix transcriptional regulator [Streptomyces sp. TRM72054]|uniref:helix-turn-helix domain-containing protein n=1 Tax=Streptomyces sp. TRM72054 TaxID=2870562 RepID=UPI0021AB36FE|nr:helix-turn-helix transcriptional regulator [Streptomyces sp. TRM72054]